jgi:energy-coupling factor transporter ATP-binding protein EcfA2
MENNPMFLARDLEIRYGPALAFAAGELRVEAGERVALVGPNGSGKSTLLKALNGLVGPSSGCLLFEGEEASSSAALRRRSVYLHQQPYLMSGTISYNVSFGARARGSGRAASERRAREAMALLGLAGFERRRHRALSGGEAQRVALARSLASGADVLLLDEPTASADAASRDLIAGALLGQAAAGATIVFSTHDRGLARELATRSLVLERGRVVAAGEGAE